MKQSYLKFSMLLLCLVMGLSSAWATDYTLASGEFNGKNATYTTGWTTTGTGTTRTDCVIIGAGENITSPSIDFSSYDEIMITFTGRRYGNLTNSKATVEATVNGTSLGTIDITGTSVSTVSGNISYTTNVAALGTGAVVFTCSNATSAGSTHGAGIGSITIVGVKQNTETYTVTFDAGENGTCSTASLKEASAGAGVTLPSATANKGYVFEGWTATKGNLVPDDGCAAGDTYKPSANVTLYAVYSQPGQPFTLVFKESGSDSDSSQKYETKDLSTLFEEGSEYVSSISSLSNVYPARTGRGAKFGTGKETGKLIINLRKAVKLGKIVVECAGYGDGEAKGFTINGTNFSSTTYAANGFEELTYSSTENISAITIATQTKRGYVKSIKVYPAGSYADLTISAAEYATYYDSENAYIMPEDCEGYAWTPNNTLEMAYEAGRTVPAGEPLVIYTIEPGTKTLVFTTTEEGTYKSVGMNLLDGTDEETAIAADADSYFYGLSLNAEGKNVGFYWMNETGAAFTNGAHKAYLKLPKSAGVKSFVFGADATAIKSVANTLDANAPIYNVAGQRVNANAKGILIQNGKKYINK